MPENNLELEPGPQPSESQPEIAAETEPELTEAIQTLEKPQDGSFSLGLQAFVAWVNSLLADHDQK